MFDLPFNFNLLCWVLAGWYLNVTCRVLCLKKAAVEKAQALWAASTTSFKSMLQERGDINVNSRWLRVGAPCWIGSSFSGEYMIIYPTCQWFFFSFSLQKEICWTRWLNNDLVKEVHNRLPLIMDIRNVENSTLVLSGCSQQLFTSPWGRFGISKTWANLQRLDSSISYDIFDGVWGNRDLFILFCVSQEWFLKGPIGFIYFYFFGYKLF